MDQFFADKLKDFEKAPPASLWSQMQERKQAKKKRGIIWFSSIAASVAVLLLAGIVIWKKFEKDNTGLSIQQTADLTKKDSEKQPVSKNPMVQKALPERKEERAEKVVALIKSVKSSAAIINKSPKVKTFKPIEPKSEVQEDIPNMPQPVEDPLPVWAATSEKTTVIVMNIAEVTDLPTSVKPSEATEPLMAKESKGEKKKTKAGRLFQQLKNVKNGEKVDWNEIGIHPESLLALVKPNREVEKTSK